ncbi:MAG TPA: DUF1656 domain-containing protein [Methylovorus sp.]|jgi:protein AaeX|nr:DUF1656 domain-containing protein [Methylovorus sp.]
MPREFALLDALVPTLLLAFIAAAFGTLLLDRLFAWLGAYRLVWYPALFRLAVFGCLFAGLGLWIYQ